MFNIIISFRKKNCPNGIEDGINCMIYIQCTQSIQFKEIIDVDLQPLFTILPIHDVKKLVSSK